MPHILCIIIIQAAVPVPCPGVSVIMIVLSVWCCVFVYVGGFVERKT